MSAADKLAIILRDSPDLYCPIDVIPGTPLDELAPDCRPNFNATEQNGWVTGAIARANPGTAAGSVGQVERVFLFNDPGVGTPTGAIAQATAIPAPWNVILPTEITFWGVLASLSKPLTLQDIIRIRAARVFFESQGLAVAYGRATIEISDSAGGGSQAASIPLVGGFTPGQNVAIDSEIYTLETPVTLLASDFITKIGGIGGVGNPLNDFSVTVQLGNPNAANQTINAFMQVMVDIFRGANT